jgi:hypothetical protein
VIYQSRRPPHWVDGTAVISYGDETSEEVRRRRKDKKQSGRKAISRARGTRRRAITTYTETSEHEKAGDTSAHARRVKTGETSEGSEIRSRRETEASSETSDRSEMGHATENGASETSGGSEMSSGER